MGGCFSARRPEYAPLPTSSLVASRILDAPDESSSDSDWDSEFDGAARLHPRPAVWVTSRMVLFGKRKAS